MLQAAFQRELNTFTQHWIGDPLNDQQTEQDVLNDRMGWCVPYTAEELRRPVYNALRDEGDWDLDFPREARRWQRAREMCEEAHRSGSRRRRRYRAHLQ
eukprot:5133502-Pyramimonas_sp.AAC.1